MNKGHHDILRQVRSSRIKYVYNALIEIRKSFIKSDKGVEVLVAGGLIERLVELLQTWETLPEQFRSKVTDISASILGNMCMLEIARKRILKTNGINAVAELLMTSESESLQNRCCRCLANILLSPGSWKLVHETPVIEKIIKLLTDSDNEECKLTYIRAIRLLGQTGKHVQAILDKKGACTVSKLLESEVENVSQPAMRCLLSLSTHCCSVEFAAQIVSSGKVTYLLTASTEKKQDAFQLIVRLCNIPNFRPEFGNANGINLFVEMFRSGDEFFRDKRRDLVDVLCMCCKEVVNRVKLRDSGCLQILVSTLSDEEFAPLHAKVISAMVCFLYDQTSFDVLLEHGLVSALIKQLSNYMKQCDGGKDGYKSLYEVKEPQNPTDGGKNINNFVLNQNFEDSVVDDDSTAVSRNDINRSIIKTESVSNCQVIIENERDHTQEKKLTVSEKVGIVNMVTEKHTEMANRDDNKHTKLEKGEIPRPKLDEMSNNEDELKSACTDTNVDDNTMTEGRFNDKSQVKVNKTKVNIDKVRNGSPKVNETQVDLDLDKFRDGSPKVNETNETQLTVDKVRDGSPTHRRHRKQPVYSIDSPTYQSVITWESEQCDTGAKCIERFTPPQDNDYSAHACSYSPLSNSSYYSPSEGSPEYFFSGTSPQNKTGSEHSPQSGSPTLHYRRNIYTDITSDTSLSPDSSPERWKWDGSLSTSPVSELFKEPAMYSSDVDETLNISSFVSSESKVTGPSEQSSESPFDSSINPKHTVNDPKHTVNDPKHTVNDPKHTESDLKHTKNDPKHTESDLKHIKNDQTDMKSEPKHIQIDGIENSSRVYLKTEAVANLSQGSIKQIEEKPETKLDDKALLNDRVMPRKRKKIPNKSVIFENNILILLSRISQTTDPSKHLVTMETIKKLTNYIARTESPLARAARLLSRVFRNPLCFESLLRLNIPTVLFNILLQKENIRCVMKIVIKQRNDASKRRRSSSQFDTSLDELSDSDRFSATSDSPTEENIHPAKRQRTHSSETKHVKYYKGTYHKQEEAVCEAGRCAVAFLEDLSEVADSSYGRGLVERLLCEEHLSSKLDLCLTLMYITWSPISREFFFKQLIVLDQVISILRDQQYRHSSTEYTAITGLSIVVQAMDATSKYRKKAASTKYTVGNSLSKEQLSNGRICVDSKNSHKTSSHEPLLSFIPNLNCDRKVCVLTDITSHDLEFVIDGEKLSANRDILTKSSDIFAAMLEGNYAEANQTMIPITNTSPVAFKHILHYLHGCRKDNCSVILSIYNTEVTRNTTVNCIDTITEADKFLLYALKEELMNLLYARYIIPDSALPVLKFAVLHVNELLQKYAVSCVLADNESVESLIGNVGEILDSSFKNIFIQLLEDLLIE